MLVSKLKPVLENSLEKSIKFKGQLLDWHFIAIAECIINMHEKRQMIHHSNLGN